MTTVIESSTLQARELYITPLRTESATAWPEVLQAHGPPEEAGPQQLLSSEICLSRPRDLAPASSPRRHTRTALHGADNSRPEFFGAHQG